MFTGRDRLKRLDWIYSPSSISRTPVWKSLRTTNALENLNREFQRRTKTQASLCTEAAAVTSPHGLVAFVRSRCAASMAAHDSQHFLAGVV